jgi:hypothetical protein
VKRLGKRFSLACGFSASNVVLIALWVPFLHSCTVYLKHGSNMLLCCIAPCWQQSSGLTVKITL